MTHALSVRPAKISVILPGTWADIPLYDAASTNAAISALLKRQVGRNDRLATRRRDAKQRLAEMARDARDINAVTLALSMEILPGVPFPASLMADYREWPPTVGEELRTVADGLAALLPVGEPLEFASGVAIRSFARTMIRLGTAAIPDIKLEYFLSVATGEKVLHIVADVPIDCDPEIIAALFDANVDSIRWFPDATVAPGGPRDAG